MDWILDTSQKGSKRADNHDFQLRPTGSYGKAEVTAVFLVQNQEKL